MSDAIPILDLFSGIGGFALGAEIANTMADAEQQQDNRERRDCADGRMHQAAQRHNGQAYTDSVDGCRRFVSIAHAEVEPFACEVYHRHFPDSVCFGGVQNVTRDAVLERAGCLPTVITGGFPCQPHSVAGKRRAGEDERDLWGECVRVLGGIRPEYALFENVPGMLTSDGGMFFNRVLSDLAALWYDVVWHVLPASAVGAPHKRDRLWIICRLEDTVRDGRRGRSDGDAGLDDREVQTEGPRSALYELADTDEAGRGELCGSEPTPEEQRSAECGSLAWPALDGQWPSRPGEQQNWWEQQRTVKSPLGNDADGLPTAMDGNWPEVHNRVGQLRGAGNSVVPQVAAVFLRAIQMELEARSDR